MLLTAILSFSDLHFGIVLLLSLSSITRQEVFSLNLQDEPPKVWSIGADNDSAMHSSKKQEITFYEKKT